MWKKRKTEKTESMDFCFFRFLFPFFEKRKTEKTENGNHFSFSVLSFSMYIIKTHPQLKWCQKVWFWVRLDERSRFVKFYLQKMYLEKMSFGHRAQTEIKTEIKNGNKNGKTEIMGFRLFRFFIAVVF